MVWLTLGCEFEENEKQWLQFAPNMPRMQMQTLNATTFLDQTCALSIESLSHRYYRSTNIACYVGEHLNNNPTVLQRMMEGGMNIARLNTTNYIWPGNHSEIIKNIRKAAKNYSERLGDPFSVAIAVDTLGPAIRTGFLENGADAEVELISGASVKITTDPAYIFKCTAQVIYVDYEHTLLLMSPEKRIYIDKGSIKLVCQQIAGAFMTCKIEQGGVLGNQKGVNLPGTRLNLPALPKIDKIILDYAVKQNVDVIFCAYISSAGAVLDIKKKLGDEGKHIKLISQIECQEGLKNLDEIISVSDGILVARGDLGYEVSTPKLLLAQKRITAMCGRVRCPVMISGEIMETMENFHLPTRAEVTDVANAVVDGADVLMLSKDNFKATNISAIIKMVSAVCKEAEATVWHTTASQNFNDWSLAETDLINTIAITAVDSATYLCAAAIFVLTESGNTAYVLAKYRPRCPIIAITRNSRVARQCNIYHCIIPFLYSAPFKNDEQEDIDAQINAAVNFGKKRNFIQLNDPIVVLTGYLQFKKRFQNTMRILYVEENLEIIDDVMYIS